MKSERQEGTRWLEDESLWLGLVIGFVVGATVVGLIASGGFSIPNEVVVVESTGRPQPGALKQRPAPPPLRPAEREVAPDGWIGFVYPDRNRLADFREIGVFDTVGECTLAARSQTGPRGAFECAHNCERGPYGGPLVCEETVGNEPKPFFNSPPF